MAIVVLNDRFRLLQGTELVHPVFGAFDYDVIFSPTLLRVEKTDLSPTPNLYSGSFQQASDGTISGTITGITSLGYTDVLFTYGGRPGLNFTVNNLNIQTTDFEAELIASQTNLTLAERFLAGDDLIYLTEQRFGGSFGQVHGYAGNDTMVGGTGIDALSDISGADRFIGGSGDDFINGGGEPFGDRSVPDSEPDIAVYSGDSTSYTLTLTRAQVPSLRVIDRVADRDGTDRLSGIEQLEFMDQTLNIDFLHSYLSLTNDQIIELSQLYTAYFNRAPDAMGLYFWAAQMEGGMTLEEISEAFSQSSEVFETFLLDGSAPFLVDAVYRNVLNRAPEEDGLAFWAEALETGSVTRGTFILEILRGVDATPQPEESAELTAQRAADLAYLDAKTDLGLYFSAIKGLNDVEDAKAVFEDFNGDADSIAASKALVDAFYADAVDPETGELLVQMIGLIDDPFAV
ncbi:MAG: DUF4214 domain-containing protein [Pseudomonadota bacterium]